MVMAMNKGIWCAQGRGLLVDLGVTREVADRVPEGGLWGHEREALSIVLIIGWQRATRGCGGICGDLVIESFGKIPCGCREERPLSSKAGEGSRRRELGAMERWGLARRAV